MFHWTDGRKRASRVIDPFLEKLLGLLEKNQVVVLTAGTSAGKTSRVPQAIALAYPKRSHVWLSQPRRKAVRKNGGWIAREMGCKPGDLVGWHLAGADGETHESAATRIHLRVDQSLLNQILRGDGLPEGVIVVDEAHERSIPIDLLLGVLKERLPESPNTRVVITSATIDARKFSEFFGGAPVIEVPGTGYSIHTEVIRLEGGEHHSQAAARGARMVMDKFLAGEPLVPALDGTELVSVSKGTVLVLLPGKQDIEEVMRSLQLHAKSRGAEERVEILECHGETDSAADDLIDQPLGEGKLRFVCATEVVRTSVTISEIIGVVDSLQVKRPIANEKGVVHLDKITISRAEAEQGKGRGGRERPAFYWPVSFKNEYENLAPHPWPAVLYSPIESVALSVAAIGKSIRTFPMMDRPEQARIEVALQRLQRLGLMDEAEVITELGREVERLPGDVASGASYSTAERLGVLPEAIIASAIRENEGVFFFPRREDDLLADEWLLRLVLSHCRERGTDWQVCQQEDTAGYDPDALPSEWVKEGGERGQFVLKCGHENFPSHYSSENGARWVAELVRKHYAGEEQSDFAASVRMLRAYKASRSPVLGQFLNRKKVGLVDYTIGLLREELAGSRFRLNGSIYREREFDGRALTKALATGLIDNVLVLDRGKYRGSLGNNVEVSRSSACPSNEVVLVGGVRKVDVPGRRGTTQRYFADLAAPLKPEWLMEVMPQLCSPNRLGNHQYDPVGDAVMETEEWHFVDTKIGEIRAVSNDAIAAAQVFSRWLAGEMAK